MNRQQKRHPKPGEVQFQSRYEKETDTIHINITQFVAIAIPLPILKQMVDHAEAKKRGDPPKPRLYLPA